MVRPRVPTVIAQIIKSTANPRPKTCASPNPRRECPPDTRNIAIVQTAKSLARARVGGDIARK